MANPIPGSPPEIPDDENPAGPAMILLNRSPNAIAALAWIWKYEQESGVPRGLSVTLSGLPSVIAPFGLEDRTRKLYHYWHTILPGSKRAVRGTRLFGDNSDVRPPQPDELWIGGVIFSHGSGASLGPLRSAPLAIDRVFSSTAVLPGPTRSQVSTFW